jgi:hypothetical protein
MIRLASPPSLFMRAWTASGVQSRTSKFRADGFELRSGADK